MSRKDDISFDEFLQFFPEVELPISISDEITVEISKVNKPIPGIAIAKFISKWDDQMDDTTEYVACCRLPKQDNYEAIVYWKGSLMTYEFVLVTIDPQGNSIDKRVIAGTISNGITVMQSVAQIDQDLCVHVAVGAKQVKDLRYDPKNSRAFYMEILPNGQFISSEDEQLIWQEKSESKQN